MSNWFQILREQLQLPNIAADGIGRPLRHHRHRA